MAINFKFWKQPNEPGADQIVRRGGASSGLYGLFGSGGSNQAPDIAPEEALQISAVYACVKLISQDVARLPWNLVKLSYDAKGRERRTIERKHPYYRLLNIKPNEWQTPFDFISTMMTQVLLTGSAIALKLRDGIGKVTAIVPIAAGSWHMEQRGNGKLVFYINTESGQLTREQSDVLFIRSPISLDGFQSFNPTLLARQAFGIASGLERIQIILT